MPTDDARERDTGRATAFAEAGTTGVPEPEEEGDPSETPDDTPTHEDTAGDPRDWDDIDAEDVIPEEYLDDGGPEEAPDGLGDGDPTETPAGDSEGTDDALYDPEDVPETDPEDIYDPEDTPGTGTEDDVYEEVTEQETEETGPESAGGGEDSDAGVDENVPQSPPLTEFDPDTGTAPIGEIDDESEQDANDAGSLDSVDAVQDEYRDVLAGAAKDILTGASSFEGWQFVAGRAADAAEDYVAVLEEALVADVAHAADMAGATADEAASLLGVGAYDPADFTPADIGLARESVFGRIIYALQQEFSSGGGMETLFDDEEDGEAVIDTLSEKLTNYVNWANGGHGDPVDAASIADLYHVAKDEDGLEKVADAAWNRGTLHGEVRSQAYVDKSESMEKIAAFTVQEVETGLTELDAHVATTDYSDSWVMTGDADVDTYVSAAVDAVKDGFKTVMTAARLWNQQEQELSADTEKKQQYDDAAAFFPDSNHAQQNRDAFYTLAEEGVTMMAAGRDALDSGLLDTIEAELGEWAQVFEDQAVGALLDITDEDYTALEDAHDAYTEAKDGLEDVAATLDSVLSYTDEAHDGAVDAIDAATAYLADLGADVVDEMAPDQAGGYGHTAVGEAMKDSHLPAYTPQEDEKRRNDLNTALRTFAGYVS